MRVRERSARCDHVTLEASRIYTAGKAPTLPVLNEAGPNNVLPFILK